MPSMFTPAARPEVVEEAAAMMLETRPAGTRAALRAFGRADPREVLPTIAVPTLLLYGELDRRSPLHVARELRAAIPASTLVVVPDAGHDVNLEAPDAFDAEVRRFLRAVDAAETAS